MDKFMAKEEFLIFHLFLFFDNIDEVKFYEFQVYCSYPCIST